MSKFQNIIIFPDGSTKTYTEKDSENNYYAPEFFDGDSDKSGDERVDPKVWYHSKYKEDGLYILIHKSL